MIPLRADPARPAAGRSASARAVSVVILAAAAALALACRAGDDVEAAPRGGPDVPIAGQQAAREADESADAQREAAAEAADARAEADAEAKAEAADAAAEPDVIAITNTEGSVMLGLRRDTVYMRLSDSVLHRAGQKLDSARAGGGLGGWIEKTVKGTVRDALSHRVAYGLDEIESVRYTNGAIRFGYHDRHVLSFEDFKTDRRSVLEGFTPDDARRFVAAVRAAKRE